MRKMMSRFGGNAELDGGGFAEGENPMDGAANLADVMLVLACGLMLALVINWNVDIAPGMAEEAAVETNDMLQQVELAGGEEESLDSDTEFEILDAVVYRDSATGKLYLVERGEGQGEDQ